LYGWIIYWAFTEAGIEKETLKIDILKWYFRLLILH